MSLDDEQGEGRAHSSEQALEALRALHAEIDREAGRLVERHGARLRCGLGCSACCLDGLSVSAIEAAWIERQHGALLEQGEPHPEGGCAFLDAEGACRIYADRPAVCRTQGLPLRVLYEDEQDEIAEHRDICPLNLEGGPRLEALDEDECWLIGPVELELSRLDRRFRGEAVHDEDARVSLRGLFRASLVRSGSSRPTTPR